MLSGSAAKAQEERFFMFVKRVGRFMKALLTALNADTFTAVSAITDEAVSGETSEDVNRTIRVMEMQGHLEVTTDASGNKSLRLTPSGVNMVNVFKKDGE